MQDCPTQDRSKHNRGDRNLWWADHGDIFSEQQPPCHFDISVSRNIISLNCGVKEPSQVRVAGDGCVSQFGEGAFEPQATTL